MKQYSYRVYNDGAFVGSWDGDVRDELEFTQEINSPGSEMTIYLARPANDFGENVDVGLGYEVRIFVIDSYTDVLQTEAGETITTEAGEPLEVTVGDPNGKLIFTGFISGYAPQFGDREGVAVTVMGYGFELDNYVIETGANANVDQSVNNGDVLSTGFTNPHTEIAQTFRAPTSFDCPFIDVQLKNHPSVASQTVVMEIRDGAVTNGGSSTPPLLAEAQAIVTGASYTTVRFVFDSLSFVGGSDYTIIFREGESTSHDTLFVGGNTAGGLANGSTFTRTEGPGATWGAGPEDIYLKVWGPTGNTTSPYNSFDPSNILKDILDDYRSKGGTIGYDSDTIDLTGTVVSYTFKVNTTLEGIKKCLELAPQDWYWYIDQATNMLHFHKKGASPNHHLVLGQSVRELQLERRTEQIINEVYLTGGDTGGGTNLFRKYKDQPSIDAYGHRLLKYSDNRITLESTAGIIGNGIVARSKDPQYRGSLEVLDDGVSPVHGYAIEDFRVGHVARLEGFDSGLDGLELQIVSFNYRPSSIRLHLANLLPDVHKRVEDIRRNLGLLETIDNPDVPS